MHQAFILNLKGVFSTFPVSTTCFPPEVEQSRLLNSLLTPVTV